MWWLAWAACRPDLDPELPDAPVFSGPTARERFVAAPPLAEARRRRLGAGAWGAPLSETPPRRGAAAGTLVALEGGRWALEWRGAWTLWDPARGLVAEQPVHQVSEDWSGWPTPDGAWVVRGSGGLPLAPELAVAPRVASWPLPAGGFVRAVWSVDVATVLHHQGRPPTDERRVVFPRVRTPAPEGAVARADRLELEEPSGRKRTLEGCTAPESVWWAPGGAFLACRADRELAVLRRSGAPEWRIAEPLDPDALPPSLSAAGDVLVHGRSGQLCVHHRDGRRWGLEGRGAAAVVTDDGSLVVVWRDGLGVFDAATGERLDPPRTSALAHASSESASGAVAALTTNGVEAWAADGRSLGGLPIEPGWGLRPWAEESVCLLRDGWEVCLDPANGWRESGRRPQGPESGGSAARPATRWVSSAGGGLRLREEVAEARPQPPQGRFASVDRLIPWPSAGVGAQARWDGRSAGEGGRPRSGDSEAEWDEAELRFRGASGDLLRVPVAETIAAAAAGGHLFAATGDGLVWVDTSGLDARFLPLRLERSGLSLAFSDDAAQVGVGDHDRIRVYAADGPSLAADLGGPTSFVPSPEGRWVWLGRADGTAQLADLWEGRLVDVAGYRGPSGGADFVWPWVGTRGWTAELSPDGAVAKAQGLSLAERHRLLLDDEGHLELVSDGLRFTVDDEGRVEVAGHAPWLDLGWLTRFPDAVWIHPGRTGTAPRTASCSAGGLACSVVPARPEGPAVGGLERPWPSPDGRWVVGTGRKDRVLLRGPDGASAPLGARDFAWAGPSTLVVRAEGRWTWWEEGRPGGSRPAELLGDLRASGDRLVTVGAVLAVWSRDDGPPSCVLPVEDGPSVLSENGRFAAGVGESGVWRADLDRCVLLQRPPSVAAPRLETSMPGLHQGALAPLGWTLAGTSLRDKRGLIGEGAVVAADGGLAWVTAAGFGWWRPGEEPRLCPNPRPPTRVRWHPDGGLVGLDEEGVRVLSAATVRDCAPMPERDGKRSGSR